MSKRFDSLNISCPKCDQSHKYKLEIDRSIVMYHLTAERAKAKRHKFTRLFICPNTNEKFQANFVIVEQFGEIINDIVSIDHQKEESET